MKVLFLLIFNSVGLCIIQIKGGKNMSCITMFWFSQLLLAVCDQFCFGEVVFGGFWCRERAIFMSVLM